MSDMVPFTKTLRRPTWREDDILPYGGWAVFSYLHHSICGQLFQDGVETIDIFRVL